MAGLLVERCIVPEDLLQVALQVLSCFAAVPPQQPVPADVQRLRDGVSGEAKRWLPNDLVAYVIKREIKGRRTKAAVTA